MPETRRITDERQIRAIYRKRMRRDFTRWELRPWVSIRRSLRRGAYDCYGLFEGETLLGYANFVRLRAGERQFLLFDYLAVDAKQRDHGLGSLFLRQLAVRICDADCILGEVEDPDCAADDADRALRLRRIAFYERAGYRDTGVRTRLFGVDYRVMEVPTGIAYTQQEIAAIYIMLYRTILPPRLMHRQLLVK